MVKAYELYQDNAPYKGVPDPVDSILLGGVTQNSGSEVRGLFWKAGQYNPPYIVPIAPGYNHPRVTLPIPYTLSNNYQQQK